MTTMTLPRPRTKKKEVATEPVEAEQELQVAEPITAVTDEQHKNAVLNLKENCLEARFTISNLPKSRRIKGKQAEAIANTLRASVSSVRGSWQMFNSKHTAVKNLNAAINDLEFWRDSQTLVTAVDAEEETEGSDDKEKRSIRKGTRLVWAENHTTYYDGIVERAKRLDEAAAKLQEDYDDVKAHDRKLVGDAWDESAYPPDVRLVVGVPKDKDGNYIVDFSEYRVATKLSPALYAQAMFRLESRISETIETAIEHMVRTLNEQLSTFLGELSNRTKINPVSGHEFEKFCTHEPAEVLKTKLHEQEPTIPAGHVKVYLAYKVTKPSFTGTKPKPDDLMTVREWHGPISLQDYQAKVRPEATGERKKLYPSVIEGLIASMQGIRDNKSKMLGEYGKNVESSFEALSSTLNSLRSLGDDNYNVAEKIADKVKREDSYRKDLSSTVANVIEALENQVEEVKIVRRRCAASFVE